MRRCGSTASRRYIDRADTPTRTNLEKIVFQIGPSGNQIRDLLTGSSVLTVRPERPQERYELTFSFPRHALTLSMTTLLQPHVIYAVSRKTLYMYVHKHKDTQQYSFYVYWL